MVRMYVGTTVLPYSMGVCTVCMDMLVFLGAVPRTARCDEKRRYGTNMHASLCAVRLSTVARA